ncbi:MAG: 2-iminoacetate synthase ThiH [Methanobrevibacter sp.]|jgi:2-iminoacetate synthase|nr:2-iminoacetate synthase ThiH [Candidatus Methanovirga basalitermitum]
MEHIRSNILNKVQNHLKNFNPNDYKEIDIKNTLSKKKLDLNDFTILLSPIAEDFIEEIAYKSKIETSKQFGNSISLFTPLYISNYCENSCIYCGFNAQNKIKRGNLSLREIEEELKDISKTGLQDILLLTGESKTTSLRYIGEAVKLARKYFSLVGLEIYPVDVDDYKYLHNCGADYVCTYQETYDEKQYKKFHLKGPKSNYEYRFNSQERAIKGGMRKVTFGSLLGLGDFRADAFATGLHGYFIQRMYPQSEISFSFLRLRPFIHQNFEHKTKINEKQLLQLILAQRLFTPFADITVSTREDPQFRNGVVDIGVNRISAGVSVGVGGHGRSPKGDEQFEIQDTRSVEEIKNSLYKKGLQPVFNNHVYL